MRLIDADEVKKRYPIMENDFGMVVNERLHKELDKIPTIESIPLSVIDEIKEEIESMIKFNTTEDYISEAGQGMMECIDVINKKVKEYIS